MSKKSDKHIKNIIGKVGIDKAPVDFTRKVMQDVFVSTNEEALKDPALSSLLKRSTIEEVSQDFVSSIMNRVETPVEINYQPLISKKTWFIISGVVIAFILFVFLSGSPKESTSIFNKVSPYLDTINNLFSNPFKGFVLSPLLTISILCLSSLLLLDTILKRRSFI
jgi:uncharacterized protein YggT (Ycf19 family)